MDAPSGMLYTASVWILPVLFAITLHEAAHGYVAWKLGDDTAKVMGRVTFNPLRHVDRFGTIILPALLMLMRSPFLFGWAKPVPVNFARLNHPRRDMVLVAAAGPGTNLVLTLISAFCIHIALFLESMGLSDAGVIWMIENLRNSMVINLILCVFNLLPLPPLDGGRIAVGLLPDSLARPLAGLEKYGLFILIGLLFIAPLIGRQVGVDFSVFHTLIAVPVNYLYNFILNIAGFY